MLNYKEIFAKPIFIVVIFFILSFSILSLVLSYYLEVETAILVELSCFVSLLLAGLLYLIIWYGQKQTFDNSNRFRFLAGKSSNVIWILDANTMQYKYVSDACFENTGYTPDDYYSKTLADMLTPESARQVKKILEDKITLLKTGKSKSIDVAFEAQQLTRWGEKNWMQVVVTLSIDRFGRVSIMGITRVINDEKKAVSQAIVNEKMFWTITNNVNDIIWILDWNSRKYLHISQSAVHITGYTPEEIIANQMQFDFFLSPDKTEFILNQIQLAIEKYQNGETLNANIVFETQLIRKDKKLVFVEIYATIVLNECFEPLEIIGVTRDISKNKQIELNLRKSEKLLQSITNNSNDHIWILNPKTMRYSYSSASVYYVNGYTTEEVLNMDLSHLFSNETVTFINNFINEKINLYKSGKIDKCYGTFEAQMRHKNGNWIWVEISATSTIDENYVPIEMYGITRVIEDKKKLEIALKNNDNKWQAITSNSNDLIWILNFKTMKYIYMSPSSTLVNGCSAEEAMQTRTFFDSFLPKDITRITNFINESLEQYKRGEISKIQRTFETQLIRKDKSLVWIEVSATATVNSYFEIVEIIGISRIIEDRKQLELALKESEEKYRYITEKSSDCIWTFSFKTMTFTYLSEAVYKLFGFEPEEAYRMKLTDSMTQESVEELLQIIKNVINDAKRNNSKNIEFIYEAQQIIKGGSVVWIESNASGTLNDDWELEEMTGVTRVIDTRKKLEIALKESEEKYRYITEKSMDCIWTLNTHSMEFTYISEAVHKLFGFTSQEMYAMQLSDVLPPDSFDKLMQLLFDLVNNAKHTGQKTIETIYEIQHNTKSGHVVWTEASVSGTLNDNWELDEILGISRVIEDKKWFELTLKESEEKYRLITENQRDIIWTMDLQTLRYTFMSGACYELTGFTVEEYLNMTAQEALPPESFGLIVSLLEEQLQKFHTGEVKYPAATFELQQYHKNGSLTWVEISARMLMDHSAGLQIIATTRGIEERKASEMQILKQNEDLEILNATKDKFFSIIAHDLKNPLAALINIASVFSDYLSQMKQSDIEKNISVLINSAQHVYNLFENLLEWARSSSGNMTFTPAHNNIMELIEQCATELKVQALVKNITIHAQSQINDCYVYCDINMIYTVIRNLISNAIKFSFEHSTVELNVVEYDKSTNFVQISVTDNGVGIDKDSIDKLFKIDKKVTTKGTASEKGTGLGLILCQEFISKHDCKIWVESEIDKGTTFFFTLPKSV